MSDDDAPQEVQNFSVLELCSDRAQAFVCVEVFSLLGCWCLACVALYLVDVCKLFFLLVHYAI